mmetsp:Transcript_29294/g.59924  ORF Transcript_29294/g.59924 Transcript_29294/m.59924 type:complete len:451 (+) Transcript_29294:25-1377(+)
MMAAKETEEVANHAVVEVIQDPNLGDWIPYDNDGVHTPTPQWDSYADVVDQTWAADNEALVLLAPLVGKIVTASGAVICSTIAYGGGWMITNDHVSLDQLRRKDTTLVLPGRKAYNLTSNPEALSFMTISPCGKNGPAPDICMFRVQDQTDGLRDYLTNKKQKDAIALQTKVFAFHHGVRSDTTSPLQCSQGDCTADDSTYLLKHNAYTRPGSSGGLLVAYGAWHLVVGGKLNDPKCNFALHNDIASYIIGTFVSASHEIATAPSRNRMAKAHGSGPKMMFSLAMVLEALQPVANRLHCVVKLTVGGIDNCDGIEISPSKFTLADSTTAAAATESEHDFYSNFAIRTIIANGTSNQAHLHPGGAQQKMTRKDFAKLMLEAAKRNSSVKDALALMTKHEWKITAYKHKGGFGDSRGVDPLPHYTVRIGFKVHHVQVGYKDGLTYVTNVTSN